MNNWFECKVQTQRQLDSGKIQKTVEPYLVDALNFTEAEARIIKEVTPYCNGEMSVTDIKRVKYSELFQTTDSDADKWYKVKCNFITYDEKTQKEKKTTSLMLVQASSLKDALKRFEEGMKGSMMDYVVAMVQETNLLDVFPYVPLVEADDKPEYEQ